MFKIFDSITPDVTLKPGEQLFNQGDIGNECFIVHTGSIELFYSGKCFAVVPKGEIIGEMALIEQTRRFATARAGKDGAKLYNISKDRFLHLVKERPEFSLEVLKVMSNRLRIWGAMMIR
ncbi:MAG: cyclic nucleotide-binding domain-containing protein [Nitrospinota bacterium]|nr:cyclic nucleotide-binding domain-containing protein [Nitrospinota bacterium]